MLIIDVTYLLKMDLSRFINYGTDCWENLLEEAKRHPLVESNSDDMDFVRELAITWGPELEDWSDTEVNAFLVESVVDIILNGPVHPIEHSELIHRDDRVFYRLGSYRSKTRMSRMIERLTKKAEKVLEEIKK